MSYVERNPVRARSVRRAWRYPWSSAAAHVGEADGTDLLDLAWWRKEWFPPRWRRELERPEDDGLTAAIRRSLRTGRPLATDSLLSRLERRLGRRLRPHPVGRPHKRHRLPNPANPGSKTWSRADNMVAAGTPVTRRPPHRSVRAA